MNVNPGKFAPAAALASVSPRVVVATVAGNALEFYDFLAYSFFAVYIGNAFFPAKTAFLSLLISVGVFGVGFVFRPLGGILIGAYADRAGRRAAMVLTIALVTVGTIGLALTPAYATIGIAAPIVVIVCRMVQGFALGGEVGTASVYLVEAAPSDKRAFYASWQIASQGLAVLAAGVVGVLLSIVLSSDQLGDWGWRAPFVLGLALIPVAIYLRRAMPETLQAGVKPVRTGRDRLGAHSGLIVLAVLVVLGGTVSTYVGNYMTTYAITTLKMPATLALSATVLGGLATTTGALCGGWLADRLGRRPVMLIPRIALAVLTWPAFWSGRSSTTLAERRHALSRRRHIVGPHWDQYCRMHRRDPRIAASPGPRDRPFDRLRGGRFDFWRLDAVHHHLSHRGHRRSDLAGLVCDHNQSDHSRGDVCGSRDARQGAGGVMQRRRVGCFV